MSDSFFIFSRLKMIEHIIVAAVCVILIGIVGYFLYNKISTQQNIIDELVHRYRSIEAVIYRPPPRQELNSLFKPNATSSKCDSCMIEPPQIQVDEEIENPSASREEN